MKRSIACCILLIAYSFSYSQKKPLDHSVYDGWQHIGERMISNDGKWVVYTIDPQEGDNELLIQSSDAKYKKSVPRGYNAVITEDSRFVVFKIKPFYKDTREAKIKNLPAGRQGKKPTDMPKDSLAIVELGKEEIWKREKIKNYKAPQKSSGWVAYQLEEQIKQPGLPQKQENGKVDNNKRIADSLTHIIDSLNAVIENMPKKKKNKDDAGTPDSELLTPDYFDAEGDDPASSTADNGNDLVLRNIATGEEIVFYNVLEYFFSKTNEKLLVELAKNPRDSFSIPQVLLYDCKNAKTTVLSKSGNDFKNFAMTDDGSQIAYVAERDARPKELQKFYRLWYYKEGMDSATLLADKFSVGMKLGMTISEYGNLSFSKSGKRLFFGAAPIQAPKDTTLVEFDHAKLDIWHYNDDYLQTVQTFPARLKAAREESFLAVYNLETKNIKQLGSKEIPQVLQTNEGDGDTFVGVTDFGKRIESQWRGNTLKDIYAIDVNTGERKLVKENLFGQVYPSSTGKYIMWYDRKARNYFAWDGTTTRNITEKIKVPFWNEENDSPDEPNNYGVMGWHEGDSAVYVYDRYDVWAIDLNSVVVPKNITGFGRPSKSSYRYLKLNEDEKFITFTQPVHFRTQNQETKESSLVVGEISQNAPMIATIDGGKYSYSMVSKAKNSDDIIYAKENYIQAPDLYINNNRIEILGSHSNMKRVESEIKLSSINPQQSNYLWGTAELVHWKTLEGKAATGILYKPENFDPSKKYPMIINFYEKRSDSIYYYIAPTPTNSRLNIPFFVSRGYLVFTPDISYTIGHPGQSAYDYIVSGAQWLTKNKWVDAKNIGIQGQSWGGYQVAYVITKTNMFKAAWAGAPVVDMFSSYGAIRWESGASRQPQYEKGQSRIGATPWEHPELYIENSPLFHLEKVTTPLVIMSNDGDGAVPWYQGIEFFTAMRRLGKKVWMLNYNGEEHRPVERKNRKDLQIRQQQYFDWLLKGEKPAKWIMEGVPAVKKGKEWGLEVE
jgi:dipeptidyl aminopeptidase/acylaminoacyl peptidase